MSATNNTKPGILGRLFGRKPVQEVPQSREAIQAWLVNRLARHLEMDPEEIDVCEPLSSYGLDSRTAVGLSGELESLLRRPLSPTLAWDYPTIELMATYLAQGPGESPLESASTNGEV